MTKRIVYQFGYAFLRPRSEWAVLDCRPMPNPYQKGVSDDIIRQWVRKLPEFEVYVRSGLSLLQGRDCIYVGCLYGRHRSVAVASEIASRAGAELVRLYP